MKKLLNTVLSLDANAGLLRKHGAIVMLIIKKHYTLEQLIRLKKHLSYVQPGYVWEILPVDQKVIIQTKNCSIKIYVK